MGDSSEAPAIRRRKLYMLAGQLKMGREDRLHLAEVILWRDVASWKELTDAEVGRLLDAFEGYALISMWLEQHA